MEILRRAVPSTLAIAENACVGRLDHGKIDVPVPRVQYVPTSTRRDAEGHSGQLCGASGWKVERSQRIPNANGVLGRARHTP